MLLYTHNGELGKPMMIADIIKAAQDQETGPVPRLPFKFPFTDVKESNMEVQTIGEVDGRTIAMNLLSCAAVIYQSIDKGADPVAAVHHAGSGHVSEKNVADAIKLLGKPPAATILVVFAHPGKSESGYTSSIETIIGQGIKEEHIVEIPEVEMGSFGINNKGLVG